MIEPDDKIHIGIVTLLDLLAIIIKCVYILSFSRSKLSSMIKASQFFRTPKDFEEYVFLLLNIVFIDLLSAFCNFCVLPRYET